MIKEEFVMEKVFSKLVRDKIPEMIESHGEVPVTRVLDDEEYMSELYKKLKEECNEVVEAETREETIEELADVLKVVKAILALEGSTLEEVKTVAEAKNNKCGGFEKRIYLEKKIVPDLK